MGERGDRDKERDRLIVKETERGRVREGEEREKGEREKRERERERGERENVLDRTVTTNDFFFFLPETKTSISSFCVHHLVASGQREGQTTGPVRLSTGQPDTVMIPGITS